MLGGAHPTRPGLVGYDRSMDAATRWETEALRTARRPAVSQKRSGGRRWVTLREAAERTGVPIGTVRSWSKTEAVDTYLELDGEHALRMVDLEGVEARARDLGRADPVSSPVAAVQVDEATRTDTMIVPIDAWNKMLMQLGNLHEAGQQLAEARERAARAETEAKFLRDQLRELRERAEGGESRAVDREPAAQGPTPAPAQPAAPSTTTSFLAYLRRGWRSRR
jgi:hypothetical protein